MFWNIKSAAIISDHMEHIKAQPYKRAYVLRGIMVEVMNLQKHPDRLLKSRAVLYINFIYVGTTF